MPLENGRQSGGRSSEQSLKSFLKSPFTTANLCFLDQVFDLLGMDSLCSQFKTLCLILVDHLNFFYSHNDARALESVQYFNFSIGNSIQSTEDSLFLYSLTLSLCQYYLVRPRKVLCSLLIGVCSFKSASHSWHYQHFGVNNVVWDCPVYYRMFSSISDLYSLDVSRTFSAVVTTENVFIHCHLSPGAEKWEQIYPQLRTSVLYQHSFCPGFIYFHFVAVCHLSCMTEMMYLIIIDVRRWLLVFSTFVISF